nr:MAG TPA: hypothetical protein [Caudoviricetes sp.]
MSYNFLKNKTIFYKNVKYFLHYSVKRDFRWIKSSTQRLI